MFKNKKNVVEARFNGVFALVFKIFYLLGFLHIFITITVLRTTLGLAGTRTQASVDDVCFWASSRHGSQTSSVDLPQVGGP